MGIELKQLETEEEIRGKAFVHWRCWHEAYPGLVSAAYLDALTLEKCETVASRWTDGILIAKDGGRVTRAFGRLFRRTQPHASDIRNGKVLLAAQHR